MNNRTFFSPKIDWIRLRIAFLILLFYYGITLFSFIMACHTAKAIQLIKHVIEPEIIREAEKSFLNGEKVRQLIGIGTLSRLFPLRDQRIQQLLGITDFPPQFDFEADWWKPTGVHNFEVEIIGPRGLKSQVAGVRIQNNVVDRLGKAMKRSWNILVGGGTRVTLVQAVEANGVWQIANIDNQIKHMVDEGSALAAAMVPKNTGLLFTDRLINVLTKMGRDDLIPRVKKIIIGGGAKADVIVALPAGIIGKEQLELTAHALFTLGYEFGKRGLIGPLLDRLAGDVGTTGEWAHRPVIEWVADGYAYALYEKTLQEGKGIALEEARAIVSGKLVGGLKARADATGLGTWEALKAYADFNKINLAGKKVSFRGCGSAARQAIKSAAEAGMKVTAIATTTAIIVCESGFTKKDADALYNISVNQKGNIADWARKNQSRVKIYKEADQAKEKKERAKEIDEAVQDYWQKKQPDVIFESATQMTINEQSANNVPDGAIIVEGGNGVTTPLAADILKKKNVVTMPGILCNAGGVFVSWFEWAQAILGVQFDPVLIEQEVRLLMEQNINTTLSLQNWAAEHNIDLTIEDVYYALAIARGLQARQRVKK